MLENFIVELDKPTKAIRILTHFIEELIYDNCNFEECENPKLKMRYILSLVYTIKLVNDDLAKLKREYYKIVLNEYKDV